MGLKRFEERISLTILNKLDTNTIGAALDDWKPFNTKSTWESALYEEASPIKLSC